MDSDSQIPGFRTGLGQEISQNGQRDSLVQVRIENIQKSKKEHTNCNLNMIVLEPVNGFRMAPPKSRLATKKSEYRTSQKKDLLSKFQ